MCGSVRYYLTTVIPISEEESELVKAVVSQLVSALGSCDALLRHTALRALLSAPSLHMQHQELMVAAVLVVCHDSEAENKALAKRCVWGGEGDLCGWLLA